MISLILNHQQNTIHIEGTFEKETSWDFIVDDKDIKKVKDFLKNY